MKKKVITDVTVMDSNQDFCDTGCHYFSRYECCLRPGVPESLDREEIKDEDGNFGDVGEFIRTKYCKENQI